MPRTGAQLSSTLSLPSPAQVAAKSRPMIACQSEDAQAGPSNLEQVITGGSKYSASSPSDFTDGEHQQYGTNGVTQQPEPEETLVGENKLVAGIDQEIEKVASEVREKVKEPIVTKVQREVRSYEIPLNLTWSAPSATSSSNMEKFRN